MKPTLVAMSLVMMLGCQPTKRSVVPPLALPQTFSATGQDMPPAQWWTSFNDAGLDRAVAMAMGDSFTLATAWDRLAQAEAVAKREGAGLWPSVDLESSASRTRTEVGPRRTYTNRFLVGLTASYEIDLWGRIRSAHDATTLDVAASRQNVQTAAITLAAAVAGTWYELAEAEAQVRVTAQQTQTNRQVLELVEERFRQGQVQAADVLSQRRQVQATEGLEILAQQRAAVLRHQLAVLLGRPPKAVLDLPAPMLVEVGALPATGVPAELVQRRPDVCSAMLGVRAQDRRVASAIASQYPRISLSADLQTSGARARDLFDDWLASLAANLLHPLFDAGERAAEVDRQRAALSEAFHDYGQTILTALRETEDALAQEAHQQQYVQNLTAQLATADQVIQRTRSSYLNGQLDYLRVLEALSSRQALEREHLTARRQWIEYRIALYRALGGPVPLNRPRTPAVAEMIRQPLAKEPGHDQ